MKGQKIEIQKAIELGKALAESSQLLRLRKAQAELHLDKEADMLYKELQSNGIETQKDPENDIRDKIQLDLEERMKKNPIISELISAQQEFLALMKDINGIIGFYVTGKEDIELNGGNCNGCSGCKG